MADEGVSSVWAPVRGLSFGDWREKLAEARTHCHVMFEAMM
jgi:hypothetical protein